MRYSIILAGSLLVLTGCQGTDVTYGYEPSGPSQVETAASANAQCTALSERGRREHDARGRDIGGFPYVQVYDACMTRFGWKRVVKSISRYG